jgi:hypothetical protein
VIGEGLNVTNDFLADSVSPGVATGLLMYRGQYEWGTATTLSGPVILNALAVNGGHFVGPNLIGLFECGRSSHHAGRWQWLCSSRCGQGNVRFSGVGSGYDSLEVRANTTSIGRERHRHDSDVLDLAGNGSPVVPTYFDLNGFNQTLGGIEEHRRPGEPRRGHQQQRHGARR